MREDESDYSKLLKIRDDVFPTFEEDQACAGDAIASLIRHDVEVRRIGTIIDLGCGTGEILDGVRQNIAATVGALIECIGIDRSAEEITIARGRRPKCKFLHERAEDFVDSKAADHTTQGSIDWQAAALMCVGHTISHFGNIPRFLDDVASLKPAYFFVDFYHRWDAAVSQLEARDAKPVQESKQMHKSEDAKRLTYMLTTKRDPNDVDRVIRGLETLQGNVPIPDCFWTSQFRRQSNWYLDEIEKRGFVREGHISYKAGYGPMHGFYFSRRNAGPA